MQEITTNEIKITTYKWIKIIQAILLMVFGGALILIATLRIKNTETTSGDSISYCIGIAFLAYGIINMLSGYLLERSPISKEVSMGIIFSALGIALFVNPNFILDIIPILLICIFYGFAVMIAIFGVDKVLGREVKKNIVAAVFLFILSGLMIALATTYIFFYRNTSLLNYVLIGIGVMLFILGIASIVILLNKIKNTRMIEKEKEIKKQQEEEWIKEREEKETKIIDYSDLKKQSGRKIHNKQIAYTPEEKKEEEPVIIIVPENEEKKEEKPEETIKEKQEEKSSKPNKRKKSS